MKQYNFPKTDKEIRMWCVLMASDAFGDTDMEHVKQIYGFICPEQEKGKEEKRE